MWVIAFGLTVILFIKKPKAEEPSIYIFNAIMNYQGSDKHGDFHVTTRDNLTDGEGKGPFGLKLIGTEGVIDVNGNGFKLRTIKRRAVPGYGGYDSFDSFSKKQKEEFKKWYKS